jgi:hypothetical protein
MHKTAKEWSAVKAPAVTSGSVAQATNVLQMALEDIAGMALAMEQLAACVKDGLAPGNSRSDSALLAASRYVVASSPDPVLDKR